MPCKRVEDGFQVNGPLADWMRQILSWHQQDGNLGCWPIEYYLTMAASVFRDRAIKKWQSNLLQKWRIKQIGDFEELQPDGTVSFNYMGMLDYLPENISMDEFNQWAPECYAGMIFKIQQLFNK